MNKDTHNSTAKHDFVTSALFKSDVLPVSRDISAPLKYLRGERIFSPPGENILAEGREYSLPLMWKVSPLLSHLFTPSKSSFTSQLILFYLATILFNLFLPRNYLI